MSQERMSLSLSNIIGIVLIAMALGASIVGVYSRLARVEAEVKVLKDAVADLHKFFLPSVADRGR